MNIDALKAQLTRHEGMRLSPYRDTEGKLTIGAGHNLDAKPISMRAALTILEDDIDDVVHDLDNALPWWRNMSENRQLAIADMAFNLGIVKLKGFANALQAMQDGRWADASREMLASHWAAQVGSRATELAGMMENG